LRVSYLDYLRGLAIISMAIFHFHYDLKIFGLVSTDFSSGFWFYFPRAIAFTFLFCVGASLYYAHEHGLDLNKLHQRQRKIFFSALGVSVVTYFLFPTQWIYFGTLHCIFVCSYIAAPLVKRPFWGRFLMVSILISQYFLDYDIKWVSSILQRPSMDFIPFYPWLWCVLLGMSLAPVLRAYFERVKLYKIGFFGLLSQNSLKIYLLHQPLFFGVIQLYLYLKR